MFADYICQWEIQPKILCVLRDGGTNFVAGFNRSGVVNLTCLAHNLQRVIHDGVLAQRDVRDLLGAGRRIVGHYKHSNVAFHALQRIQAQLELKVCTLYQDEPTRWNSSFYMLKRLVEQRKAINAANAEASTSFDLTPIQWKLAGKVIKSLQPFEEATEDLSSETSLVALFIPIVNWLNRLLQVHEEDHGTMAMKRKMLSSMENRIGNCEIQEIYCLLTMLDPQFKNKVFANQPAMGFAQELLTSKCEKMLRANQADHITEATPSAPKRARKDDTDSVLWAQVDEMLKVHEHDRGSSENDEHSICQKMVSMYLSEVNAP